jgi:penicillin-binding protein 1A
MVTAFSTLASGGVYTEPVAVLKIEDRHGEVLYEAEEVRREVIAESVTAELVDMMRSVIDEGTGRRIRFAYDIHTDVAGKTGTTQEGADGWFLLMHPDLVAGSWVGFDDRRITFRSSYWGQGAHTALPIVGEFFRDALRDPSLGLENRPAPPPEVRYVRTRRSGVEGWLRDVFNSPIYERVVVESVRPKSNLGLRTTTEDD